MKHLLAVHFLILTIFASNGQTLSFNSERKKKIKFIEHVGFTFYGPEMTPIELEIGTMESRECEALLKRDTATLISVWARDFTLDEPANGLVSGKNTLPYYTSLSRLIERCSVMDNTVFTSGTETVQILQSDGKLPDPIQQTFFHTWTRKPGGWKLTTKTK
jgi:ketosteroid isomerase-like protein